MEILAFTFLTILVIGAICWVFHVSNLHSNIDFLELKIHNAENTIKLYEEHFSLRKSVEEEIEAEAETMTIPIKKTVYNVKHYLPNGDVNEYIVNQALLDSGRVVVYPEKDKRIYLYGTIEVEKH